MKAIFILVFFCLVGFLNGQETQKRSYQRKPEEGQKHLSELLTIYPDKESWINRKSELKECISNTLGTANLKLSGTPEAVAGKERIYGDYSVSNIAIETVEGIWVAACVYKPYPLKGKLPLVLCPHGHFSDKDTNLYGRYRPDMQYRCAMLAKMGVIAVSYDMFDWGESRLQFGGKLHRTDLALTVQTLNSRRIIDYFSGFKYTDKRRIAITGASGGGTQSFLAAALDDRISLCVPVVMVSSYFDGGCPCESGLPIHLCTSHQTNNAEIAAMIAPRPMLIVSDGDDWTKDNPDIEFPYLRKIYSLTGHPGNIENVHLPNEKHDYGYSKRIAMCDFVSKHFGLKTEKFRRGGGDYDESSVVIEPYRKMVIFRSASDIPSGYLTGYEEVRKVLSEL